MEAPPNTAHAVAITARATAVVSATRHADQRLTGDLAHMTISGVSMTMPMASPSHQVSQTALMSAGTARPNDRSAAVPTVAAITGAAAPANTANRRVASGRAKAAVPPAKRLTIHTPASASRVLPAAMSSDAPTTCEVVRLT